MSVITDACYRIKLLDNNLIYDSKVSCLWSYLRAAKHLGDLCHDSIFGELCVADCLAVHLQYLKFAAIVGRCRACRNRWPADPIRVLRFFFILHFV